MYTSTLFGLGSMTATVPPHAINLTTKKCTRPWRPWTGRKKLRQDFSVTILTTETSIRWPYGAGIPGTSWSSAGSHTSPTFSR